MIESRGVPHENIHVIPNGIDPGAVARIDGTRIRRSLKFATDELVLGFVGFLRDWHRLDRVVRLLARDGNDKLRFLVVGDGPARRALAELADSLGVSHRLVFTGLVPRGEILDYVAAFDIALQPDVVEYASPLKLLEYLALGRPIVAPDRPNIRELVSDGENGLLFAPDDEGAFESAVLELCGSSDLRERLSQRAARTIGERGLTWKANAARVVDIAQSAS
jgi:glycosyltransferase involved in cell wall biosynthesis